MRRALIYTIVVVGILAGGVIGRHLILGGAPVVFLKVDPISDQVAKSLQGSGGGYLPILGKDYVIKNTKYFENKQWVVVSTQPVGTASDALIIIFHKNGNSYEVTVGPTNFFANTDVGKLPTSVINYLKDLKLL